MAFRFHLACMVFFRRVVCQLSVLAFERSSGGKTERRTAARRTRAPSTADRRRECPRGRPASSGGRVSAHRPQTEKFTVCAHRARGCWVGDDPPSDASLALCARLMSSRGGVGGVDGDGRDRRSTRPEHWRHQPRCQREKSSHDAQGPKSFTESAPPPRRILSLDCSRVGWFAEGVVVSGEDYVEHRTGTHTGDMLDEHGRPVAKIMDCTPYQIDPAEGLPLSGPTTFGRYVSDDGDRSVLGHVLVPEPRVSGVAVSVALRVKLFDKLVTESCLFWMGTGWGNHFGIRHYRGKTFVECCPDDSLQGWEHRVEVGDEMHLEVGRPVAVIATMGACGRMRLYVDGVLIAEGVGLGGVRRFSPQHIGRRRACHVGRWFRPDQSFPTSAGLMTCEIFDGEVDAAWVARHWDQTPKPKPPEYVVPPKPPPRAGKAPPSNVYGEPLPAPSAPPAPPPKPDDVPTANYDWIKVFEHRAGKGVVLDHGAESIKRLFHNNFKVWRYDVNDEPLCYYLRHWGAPSDEFRRFDAYSSMLVQFDHEDNKIHRDFEVYSTEIDLAKKRNEWKTITQDQPAGFPGGEFFASTPGCGAYHQRGRADVTFAFYIPTLFLGARLVHGKEFPVPPGGRYPVKGELGYKEPYE